MAMLFTRKLKRLGRTIFHNLETIIGIVLIWRGTWYVLDYVDVRLFGGSHVWTALAGILLGIAILFIPDHNHSNLEKTL